MAPGLPFARNARWVEPMVEIDGRVGWYAGATVKRSAVFEARALRFDNRGKQTVFDGWQYAWLTRFSAFGLRIELPGKIHLIGQHMDSETHMGRTPAGDEAVLAPFRTTFGLLSIPIRRHRLSFRYERFRTEDADVLTELDPNDENGSRGRPATRSMPASGSGSPSRSSASRQTAECARALACRCAARRRWSRRAGASPSSPAPRDASLW